MSYCPILSFTIVCYATVMMEHALNAVMGGGEEIRQPVRGKKKYVFLALQQVA